MQEVFYEESAKQQSAGSAKTKFYVFKAFSIASYVIAALWFIIVIGFYPVGEGNIWVNLIFMIVPFSLFLVSGILLGKFKERFYVDYDYTFVSGSIRFSKVIKEIKRKSIIVFDVSSIEKIGFYGSDTYSRYEATPDKKRMILTSNTEPEDGKDFYYIVCNSGGQKYLFIIECSEKFISHVIRFSNRTVLEDDFMKTLAVRSKQ